MPNPRGWTLALLLGVLGPVAQAAAGETTAAVATNFTNPARTLIARFETGTGHRVHLVTGSTGKLYAQILHGAPFDVFLAADRARPQLLEAEGRAAAGTRFTYARGRLVLWSATAGYIKENPAAQLKAAAFNRLAIANPKTAPYGQAARAVLLRLGLWDTLQPKLVRGENIGQAFQFVATGNAELGLVARSQVRDPNLTTPGSGWDVPPGWHPPLDQDAVLLERGAANAAARAFLDYLKGPAARALIEQYGYAVP